MAEATPKQKDKTWRRRLRGGSVMKSSSKLFDAMNKSSKEKLKSQKMSIDEGLVDPSTYLDLFAMASQVISSKTDYYSEVRMMPEEQEIERRPPCNFSKEKESKCRLDDTTREDLYKLLMRVVNSATVLEDRLTDGKISAAEANASFTSQQMLKQLQDILQASTEEQKIWQARLATTAKYQKVLILTVHQAHGLPSADQDGFSDPYCRMGLVPRDKSVVGKLSLKSIPDPDQMEKSKIQRKTLDPVWEETFELLLVEQPRVLVMEVWDDDIAQQNEGRSAIKGLRGLKFKIVDFFKPGQDDFLGKRCIDINTLHNERTQHEFQLHGKSLKKNKGNIQITTEIIVRVQDSELETIKTNGYGLSLLRDFYIESARHQYIKDVDINRDHSMKDIHTFIADKVIQLLQVDSFSQSVARLGGVAKYLICFSYQREQLKGYLEEIIANWETQHTSLTDDVTKGVVENIEEIFNHEMSLLKQSRVLFPPNSNTGQSILKEVIQTITTTFNFLQKIERVDTNLELNLEIEPNLKEDIHSWYQVLNANSQPLQLTTTAAKSTHTIRITTLTNLCAEVAQDLITVHMLYPQAFEQTGISYFDIAYQILDEIVSHEVSSLLSSSTFRGYFEQISKEDKKLTEENKREQFTLAILILKLYEYVKDICQFKEHIISEDLKAKKYNFEHYQAWFKPYVLSWMDVARNISIGTVKRAIEIDTREVIHDNKIKVTSSAIDITICFEQCYQFNRQLSWRHEEEGSRIIAKIVKMICDIGKFYSTQMIKIMIGDLDKKDKKPPILFELNENICVGINNTQVVLEYMREIPTRLNWEELIQESEDNRVLVEDWRKILDNSIAAIEGDKSKMLREIIVAFTKQFKIYFNDFMKKPLEEPIDDAIDVLMNWMANNLEGAWTTLMHNNFQLLLECMWTEIVKMCSELQKSKSKQISYCTKMAAALDIFYNFLYVDGNGLKTEDLESDEYKLLKSALNLYGDNTEDLIAIYCSQLTETNKTVEMKYGSLTFSVYHLESENVLKFKLIRGENLPKMDTIGSCDPYIKFKTLPKELFEKVETKHQSNTQNPTWKLDLDFKMNENPSTLKGACLQMSLYDYDLWNKNDYGGSVYLAIDEIAKTKEEAIETTLNIMFPIHTQILCAIYDRSDKDASKFSKRIKKYIEAESELSTVGKEKGKKSKKKDKKKK